LGKKESVKNAIGIDKFGIDKFDVEVKLTNWNRVELENWN